MVFCEEYLTDVSTNGCFTRWNCSKYFIQSTVENSYVNQDITYNFRAQLQGTGSRTQLNDHLSTQVLKHLNVHIYLVTIACRYYNILCASQDDSSKLYLYADDAKIFKVVSQVTD